MLSLKRCNVLCAGLCGVLLCGAALADGAMGTATIKGKVMLDGEKPPVGALDMNADKACAALHTKAQPEQGKIVFGDGSVPYAFVWLKSGVAGKYDPPKEPLEINQEGCMYKPHVMGMVAGQAILVKNSDDTAHNIHSLPQGNTPFNFSQPKKGLESKLEGPKTFNRPEVMVKVKCDVHPWMSCYIGVVAHPFFAVTGKGGEFEIKNVPAGKYKLEAWHETFGKVDAEIDVADGATVENTLTFSKKGAVTPAAREVTIASAQ